MNRSIGLLCKIDDLGNKSLMKINLRYFLKSITSNQNDLHLSIVIERGRYRK